MLSLSVVIPATDGRPTDACVGAIRTALDAPDEIVVVDSPAGLSPAAARNEGARRSKGDVVVFVDSDVIVREDAFRGIRGAFARNPELAAVFGAYDDDPGGGPVSDFRNLLHHHVHSSAAGDAKTFWAGIGAVRKDDFRAVGGFDEKRYSRASVEDIELGMRLVASGRRILLDPAIQGKHLKRWTVRTMTTTDLLRRGAPWIKLLLEQRGTTTALNLGWRHRASAAVAVLLVTAAGTGRVRAAAGILLVFTYVNSDFYRLLYKRGGARHLAAGIPLHLMHHLVSVAAVPVGIAGYLRERYRG